jgi:hypothetical protein
MTTFIIPEKIKQNIQTELSQTPTPVQRKMIAVLAEELTEQEYHELCHQLYGSKAEFDQEDGECTIKGSKERKYFYTVQSALYRGIFWETLERLDFYEEREKKFRVAEEEWLDPSEFYERGY